MKIEIVTMTPELATELLAKNTRNRNLNSKLVASYARAMVRGDWKPNGEAYKISLANQVLDGQHRLAAVGLADVDLPLQVLVSGLPTEAQDTMDTGRKRTTADALSIHGMGNANVLASVTRRVWMWDRGNFKFTNTEAPTTAEILETIQKYPSLHRSAEIGVRTGKAYRPANATVTGIAHHLFHHIDEDVTTEFFAQLATGAGLDEGHPVLTLRNRLVRDKVIGKNLTTPLALAYFVRAWNAVREDRSLTVIIQMADEPMPMPR
jgi:hypothetical protein